VASDTVPLAEFDPAMARAVAQVLRRAGVPAQVAGGDPAASADVVVVVVPEGRREEAFAVLARSMEDVHAARRSDVPRGASQPSPAAANDPQAPGEGDVDTGRPLLFERLRQLGFLPVLLVPLVVVALAQVRLPGAYTAALVIGGIVALYAWRNGRRDRTEE
jgi:hypothetical protein